MEMQPFLHLMVMEAPDGASLGAAMAGLPVESWDTNTALAFLSGGEDVYETLLAGVSTDTAVQFHQAQLELLRHVAYGNKAEAARARRQLAMTFKSLNGSWKGFRARFDVAAQRSNILESRSAAIARLRDSLTNGSVLRKNGVVVKSNQDTGELEARKVTVPMPTETTHPKVVQLLDLLKSKNTRFADRYSFVLNNSPTPFFENLADVLVELERESRRHLAENTPYDFDRVVEMGQFAEAIEATLPLAQKLLPADYRIFEQRLRGHGYQIPRTARLLRQQVSGYILEAIKARAAVAKKRLGY